MAQREIERVYSAEEDIPPEKIKLFNESIKKKKNMKEIIYIQQNQIQSV